jgi:hypothetical protein
LLSIGDEDTVAGTIRRLKSFAEVLHAEPNQINKIAPVPSSPRNQ